MPQNGPRDEDAATDGYERRTILTGAGSLAIGGLLGSSGLASATPGRDPGPKKDELIVGFSPSVSDVAAEARAVVPGNADVVHANEKIYYATVSFPADAPDEARDRFIDAVTRSKHVEYVERNATLQSFVEPNDTYYGYQHAPERVNCETAWETTLGSEDVVVATVDQGIQYDHPDLEETARGSGADYVGGDGDPYPSSSDESHGTHVGGIVAAKTDNGTGSAGISDCSVLAARALDASGRGSLSDIADAIQWAADAGADVINLSLGAPDDYHTLAAACEYALEQGSLLVGAAGNEAIDGVAYPAAYEDVLAVSALDENDALASFSNSGPEIDLAAPGTGLVSTVPWNGYARMSGTSMATPVVSGVAGLALSAYPDLSAAELREHLRNTAVDVGLEATEQGEGRVDAAAAVETDPFADENGSESDAADEEGGECGDEIVLARADGSLSGGWWGESDRYRYSLNTDDPCSATITLDGPSGADFDLYVTLDGRKPTRWDHDEAADGSGSGGELEVDLEDVEKLRLQVHANTGSGEYVLRIEERGR